MRKIKAGMLLMGLSALIGCSPVKMPITNQYQLNSFSSKHNTIKGAYTILVTTPEAVAGYQTQAMLYIKKPYQLEHFANNAWVDTPANMLYPLLLQSLQSSGSFAAVSSSPYTQGAMYRLDTQVLHLEQNFISKPSVLVFSIKVVLTRVSDNKVLASRILIEKVPCPQDTPYGGVLAANTASYQLTQSMTQFVISSIKAH